MAPTRRSQRGRQQEEEEEQHEQQDDATAPSVRSDIRDRNRAVAEREAARLARPEQRIIGKLSHASRSKSAVTSTPSGFYAKLAAAKASPEEAEEWCGPFSVARQMIAKREEARRKREAEADESTTENHPLDAVLEQVELEKKRKAHPSLQWKSKLGTNNSNGASLYSKRQKRAKIQTKGMSTVPSLFQICVDFLVANFEHVEALGDVDSSIRRAVCEALVAKNKLNADAFDSIAEEGIEALELVDCAEVTQDQLSKALKKLLPSGLKYVELNHSGRCFGPKAVEAIISSSGPHLPSSLFAISIGGAYLLKDEDAARLLRTTGKTLSSVSFKACPLLSTQFCKAVNEVYSSTSSPSSQESGRLLELSLEDLKLTKEDLLTLAADDSVALRHLKSLTLKQIGVMDDDIVLQLLGQITQLEAIDLSHNYNLTDECLSGIRKCNKTGSLRSLELGGLKNLTEIGLEALFTPNIPGLPSPPMLRKVNLASCQHSAVSDTVLKLICEASSMKRNSGDVVSNSVSMMGGLVYVNINGSSCGDDTMEELAATSASSLRELDMSFSPKVSDKGIGYLVSKAGPHQFRTLHVWGCAQLTDEFYDGHDLALDGSFRICGTWMKKYGGVTSTKES